MSEPVTYDQLQQLVDSINAGNVRMAAQFNEQVNAALAKIVERVARLEHELPDAAARNAIISEALASGRVTVTAGLADLQPRRRRIERDADGRPEAVIES